MVFDVCSKFCSDVLRGLQYLADKDKNLVDKVKFHRTFSIKSVITKTGTAKLANNIRDAYDGNTCSRCVNDRKILVQSPYYRKI